MIVAPPPVETADAFAQSTALMDQADPSGEDRYDFSANWYQSTDWCVECLNHVERLRELGPNWDSYGACAVHLDSIQIAKQLLRQFAEVKGIACPRVGASPAGHVALSWEWQNHSRELDLEVLPDGLLRYAYLDEAQPSRDREGTTFEPTLIAQLLTQW